MTKEEFTNAIKKIEDKKEEVKIKNIKTLQKIKSLKKEVEEIKIELKEKDIDANNISALAEKITVDLTSLVNEYNELLGV